MASLMKKQAEKFLREKKRHRRWLAVFLCLALLVTSGTFTALRMNGHAMDHGDRELDCKLRLHEHTEECCNQEGKLICGKADYVVHTHKSDCYSPEGELVCTLPEREAHVHDSSCYEDQKVLVCKEKETSGHVHSPECYIEEKGEPQCGLGEHEHDWSCYDENGNIVCGQAAHYHDDSCYLPTEVLVCGQEEGGSGHTHTEDCYKEEKILTCGELELHTHDEETCYDENGELTCDELELEEHEHGEGCFSTAESKAKMEGDGEETVSGDAVSENTAPEDIVSGDSVSGDSVSGDEVSENSVSENTVSENQITLATEADGTTITLSGPESSFEKDREYELQAKAIKENSKEGKQIQKAIDEAMEKEEGEAEKYRAFDIKLMSGGEEVQPQGSVSVNFVSKDIQKSVADENTEVSIFHVDDKAKKAEDMEAEMTEEGTVTMETTHFSIYVIVDLGKWGGKVNVTLEHWGENIETLEADGTTDPYHLMLDANKIPVTDDKGVVTNRQRGLYTKDDVYDRINESITPKFYEGELYRSDTVTIENELNNYSIEKLSKIFLGMGNTSIDKQRYQIEKIWISDNLENKDKPKSQWEDYTEIEVIQDSRTKALKAKNREQNEKTIELNNDSLIRFWYKETTDYNYKPNVTFYDYDITGDNVRGKDGWGTSTGISAGINKSIIGDGSVIGVGQNSSGNLSPWATSNSSLGFLNQGNRYDHTVPACTASQNAINYINGQIAKDSSSSKNTRTYFAMPVRGIVKENLTEDGNYDLQFEDGISYVDFFGNDSVEGAKTVLDNYYLGFERKGDTYKLSTVERETEKGKETVLPDLQKIRLTGRSAAPTEKNPAGSGDSNIYSNNFFPLDKELDGDGRNIHDGYRDVSDDHLKHNWHFGMRYSFNFRIDDYTGPMNYYFRGDDDFWLFVDGVRAIDLGGIHSAIGQALDLRKWMDDHGLLTQLHQEHRIDIFYMERGGFGSCCYMQFTLPNCKPAEPLGTKNHLNVVAKKVWADEGTLKNHDPIKVNLVRTATDMSTSGSVVIRGKETRELNEGNEWTYIWEDLPSVDINNENIHYDYYIEEPEVPEGYICDIGEREIATDGKTTTYTYTVTNTESTIDISAEKIWNDEDDKYQIRPKEIQVQLKADGKPLGTPRILKADSNPENAWKARWEHLPKYKQPSSSSQKVEIKYMIEEISPPSGYITSDIQKTVSSDEKQTSFVIKNTLDPEWKIIKRNRTTQEALSGAEFTLTRQGDTSPAYTGESGNDGVIKWTASGSPLQAKGLVETAQSRAYVASDKLLAMAEEETEEEYAAGNEMGNPNPGGFLDEESSGESIDGDSPDGFIEEDNSDESINSGSPDESVNTGDVSTARPSVPNKAPAKKPSNTTVKVQPGTYILAETKAPAGFALSGETWTITIAENGVFQSITKNDENGNPMDTPIQPEYGKPNGIVMATFYFDNVMFYELPSTGGTGIYWYMFGGVLLMAAASLMTYRNKRREVLMR